MRAIQGAAVLLSVAAAMSCGGKVEDTSDGGSGGGPVGVDCATYCHALDDLRCSSTTKLDDCLARCAGSLSSCNTETRAYLSCALQPGVMTCEYATKLYPACSIQIDALTACTGTSAGTVGSSSGSSPGPSGSAPAR